MRARRAVRTILVAATLPMLWACAGSRSDLKGSFQGPQPSGPEEVAEPVTVAFIFTHSHYNRGWDVIPKLHGPDRYAHGFYDLFRDALPELTNVGSYATFTDRADDVTDPTRRAMRDSLRAGSHDFVIEIRFLRETSFARQAMGTLVSALSLTLLPVPYRRSYTVTADLRNRAGRLLERYERQATVTRWVELFLVFAYPFHPESRKTEEVYLDFLHDTFREIESDRALVPTRAP